jgi:hydrogenase assembly chaperone HypC/HupF
MCLSIPYKILEIKNNKAIADFQGKREEVGTELIKDIKINDYAIISDGFIIKKISAQEAEEIFSIIKPKKEGK